MYPHYVPILQSQIPIQPLITIKYPLITINYPLMIPILDS